MKLKLKLNGMFVLCIFLMPSGAFAAADKTADKKVSVSGECTVEVTPDKGSVIFVAENTSMKSKEAIQKATTVHETLREELKKLKVKNLELVNTEYSVQERREWENNRSVSKGYQCRIGLKAITTDIAALGDLVAAAAKVDVKETYSMQTFLSDQKNLEERKKCLEVAAKNAREKADVLVKSLNARLGSVLQVQERMGASGGSAPVPMMEMATMKAARDVAPSIEGQKQSIHQEVDVTFAIE